MLNPDFGTDLSAKGKKEDQTYCHHIRYLPTRSSKVSSSFEIALSTKDILKPRRHLLTSFEADLTAPLIEMFYLYPERRS